MLFQDIGNICRVTWETFNGYFRCLMSKARSIIMSVVVKRRTQADTARLYEVSRSWVSKLVARYHAEGDSAFKPRSRRPDTSTGVRDPLCAYVG